MYKMKSINPIAMLTIICFVALEAYMFFEILSKHRIVELSILMGGSLVALIISLLISLLLLPISRRYFFYEINDNSLVVKYYFRETKFNLIDIKSVEFDKDYFKVFLKNGSTHIEKNRLNNSVYENFQAHFRKIISN